ncbi:hypothetical protein HAX54_021951 [Datura stramonium]|uniref:Uncharacterized protein n=1 Tax=Datura stramonium TaxID=4076 RepID=A0ABS8UWI0_DATST|nr:hypothetical protein [Datura stramonium]
MQQVEGVFDLAKKRAKDALSFKRLKLASSLSAPPLIETLGDASVSPLADKPTSPQLVVEKLGSLGAQVEVLEEEVASMWEEMDIQNPSKVAAIREVHYGEPPSDKGLPNKDFHHDDSYWEPPIYSYHEDRTLLDKWVVTSPHGSLALPLDPLMSSLTDIAK